MIVKQDVTPKSFREADVIFSGILTKIDDLNDRLLFRVDRVWKGPVGREIWIYQLDPPFIGSYSFRARHDTKYIIFARHLSAEERQFRVPTDQPPAFGIPRTCGEGPRWSNEAARKLDWIKETERE